MADSPESLVASAAEFLVPAAEFLVQVAAYFAVPVVFLVALSAAREVFSAAPVEAL